MGRHDTRKLAMYSCQHIGDVPLKGIALQFGLSHVGIVFRAIHDVKALLESGELKKIYNQVQNLLDVIKEN